ncbi:MAG: molybdate ABC transporter substrate-binding protein [Acidimicrobiia bacterium]|nr:molybdate ABC transporter substrate-binding protein [Acidimicrobiia bacterium]
MVRWSRRLRCSALLAAVVLVASCGPGPGDGDGGGDGDGRSGAVAGELTVVAASSLTGVLTDLADAFEEDRPEIEVRLSFAASPTIVAQVQEGAPADLVATADDLTMEHLIGSGDVHEPRVFARNRLAIAVERGNPEGIDGLEDLGRSGLVVVLCDSAVPCGRLADEALTKAGVSLQADSREQNVKATLGRVELGEADAAIVYATDTEASTAVDSVAIPAAQNASTALPIAVVRGAGNRAGAEGFVEFLLSDAGRAILLDAGFLKP